MSEPIVKRLRCAVYTRKSSEEGLEQEYNSIDAQRDAGHAYIASQRAMGWVAVEEDYDDPGYSGGTMERPGLERLLMAVEDGKIDIVVVYKIDRLTRSLYDFSKIIELFEESKVSFASVTQQFDTTNSMGRLMLHILLSFAQFEREVTGERIRDKFAASKRKGLWMGGVPPLGYDVIERALVVNKEEAKLVEHIFKRFISLGSSTLLVKELQAQGVTSKRWVTKSGVKRGGKPICKALIYWILHNRIYLGKVKHKDKWYPGLHAAIISQALWDEVQQILSQNNRKRANQTRAKVYFLLKGLVCDPDGRAFTVWSSTRRSSGRCYRYYVNTREDKEYAGRSKLPRLPAGELEAVVVQQIRKLLQSPPLIEKVTQASQHDSDSLDEAQVNVALRQIDKVWEQLFPEEQTRIVKLLVEKVIITPDNIEMRLHKNGIERLALELAREKGVA